MKEQDWIPVTEKSRNPVGVTAWRHLPATYKVQS